MSCFRWSMGEISSHGIECLPASSVARSVTHVPGLFCYPCPWTAPTNSPTYQFTNLPIHQLTNSPTYQFLRSQFLERCARRFLLRLLLARPGGGGERLAPHDHLDLEQLAVIGPERPDQAVLRQRQVARLQKLLQRRLVVLARDPVT